MPRSLSRIGGRWRGLLGLVALLAVITVCVRISSTMAPSRRPVVYRPEALSVAGVSFSRHSLQDIIQMKGREFIMTEDKTQYAWDEENFWVGVDGSGVPFELFGHTLEYQGNVVVKVLGGYRVEDCADLLVGAVLIESVHTRSVSETETVSYQIATYFNRKLGLELQFSDDAIINITLYRPGYVPKRWAHPQPRSSPVSESGESR